MVSRSYCRCKLQKRRTSIAFGYNFRLTIPLALMNRFASMLALVAMTASVSAQELATCLNPEGHAYYPQRGIVQAKDAGWTKDKISPGIFTLRKVSDDDYDVLYVDATKGCTRRKAKAGT